VSFKHNPEFTVVECSEAYADYSDGHARVTEESPRRAVRGRARHDVIIRDGRDRHGAAWPRKPLGRSDRGAAWTSWRCGSAADLRDGAGRARQASGGPRADATWPQLVTAR